MTKLNRTILIVEDEKDELEMLQDNLEREGFSTLGASDGEYGLQIALAEHPDLILLDIILPKMDGITLLQKLRDDKWGKDVPVLILTNLKDSKKITGAMKGGVYDYLIKVDWNLKDIVGKVKQKLAM